MGGGCWSQLKTCSSDSGKDFFTNHRAKIGSISLGSFKRNSVSATGPTQLDNAPALTRIEKPPPPRRTHHNYKKRNSGTSPPPPVNHLQAPPEHQQRLYSSSPFMRREDIMGIKLYSVSDSPPTLAVRMALKYLSIDYELINIDYAAGEQVSEAFREKNPQGEVPVLDDNGFVLSESVAILQYLADKYKKDDCFYPAAPQQRAIVNHRLAFHLSTYYKAIVDYMILPLCYAYPRTEENLKKLLYALRIFEEYLRRSDTTYAAAAHLTIADLPLIMGTVCLEAMGLDLSPFPRIQAWYENFKTKNLLLWGVGIQGLEELSAFEKNPPDLSHVKHPIHPTDKSKLK